METQQIGYPQQQRQSELSLQQMQLISNSLDVSKQMLFNHRVSESFEVADKVRQKLVNISLFASSNHSTIYKMAMSLIKVQALIGQNQLFAAYFQSLKETMRDLDSMEDLQAAEVALRSLFLSCGQYSNGFISNLNLFLDSQNKYKQQVIVFLFIMELLCYNSIEFNTAQKILDTLNDVNQITNKFKSSLWGIAAYNLFCRIAQQIGNDDNEKYSMAFITYYCRSSSYKVSNNMMGNFMEYCYQFCHNIRQDSQQILEKLSSILRFGTKEEHMMMDSIRVYSQIEGQYPSKDRILIKKYFKAYVCSNNPFKPLINRIVSEGNQIYPQTTQLYEQIHQDYLEVMSLTGLPMLIQKFLQNQIINEEKLLAIADIYWFMRNYPEYNKCLSKAKAYRDQQTSISNPNLSNQTQFLQQSRKLMLQIDQINLCSIILKSSKSSICPEFDKFDKTLDFIYSDMLSHLITESESNIDFLPSLAKYTTRMRIQMKYQELEKILTYLQSKKGSNKAILREIWVTSMESGKEKKSLYELDGSHEQQFKRQLEREKQYATLKEKISVENPGDATPFKILSFCCKMISHGRRKWANQLLEVFIKNIKLNQNNKYLIGLAHSFAVLLDSSNQTQSIKFGAAKKMLMSLKKPVRETDTYFHLLSLWIVGLVEYKESKKTDLWQAIIKQQQIFEGPNKIRAFSLLSLSLATKDTRYVHEAEDVLERSWFFENDSRKQLEEAICYTKCLLPPENINNLIEKEYFKKFGRKKMICPEDLYLCKYLVDLHSNSTDEFLVRKRKMWQVRQKMIHDKQPISYLLVLVCIYKMEKKQDKFGESFPRLMQRMKSFSSQVSETNKNMIIEFIHRLQ